MRKAGRKRPAFFRALQTKRAALLKNRDGCQSPEATVSTPFLSWKTAQVAALAMLFRSEEAERHLNCEFRTGSRPSFHSGANDERTSQPRSNQLQARH